MKNWEIENLANGPKKNKNGRYLLENEGCS